MDIGVTSETPRVNEGTCTVGLLVKFRFGSESWTPTFFAIFVTGQTPTVCSS